jgi:hypothetical protein
MLRSRHYKNTHSHLCEHGHLYICKQRLSGRRNYCNIYGNCSGTTDLPSSGPIRGADGRTGNDHGHKNPDGCHQSIYIYHLYRYLYLNSYAAIEDHNPGVNYNFYASGRFNDDYTTENFDLSSHLDYNIYNDGLYGTFLSKKTV